MRHSNAMRFGLLISGSIVIALLLVSVSIAMYFSSGTAQLDLSRPGYQSVRDQTTPEDPYKGFAGSGPVDEKVLDEFEKQFKERSDKATSVDAFNNDVMSDAALGINDIEPQPQQ
mgnify:CR=1 FL=1